MMSQRSFSGRRSNLASLVSPALLLLLVQAGSSCSSEPVDPATTLAMEFPRHASTVLRAGQGFARTGTRFAVAGALPTVVDLPGDGAGAIVFHAQKGATVRVREVGAAGAGRIVDRAVAYPRSGGASFWTTAPGGAEEWIHLAGGRDAGRAHATVPVTTWQVEGATVRTRGSAVELVGPGGVTLVRVTAPEAYAPGGRRVDVRLTGSGSTVAVFVADDRDEAVLIDPIWNVVAPMLAPRADHKAGVLGSGKVVVAGGSDDETQSLDTAELYDPAADAWTDVGPMNATHVCHTATALNDGTVLVVGGMDNDFFASPEGDSETYSESDGWSRVGYLNVARLNHAAGLLKDGRVLVTGGIGQEAVALVKNKPQPPGNILPGGGNTCWSYSTGGGSGGSGGGGSGGSGGSGGHGATSSAEIYDPTTQMWTEVAFMNSNRERHTETVLVDGRVLVTGGDDQGFMIDDFEVYDPTLDSWSYPDGNALTVPRMDHTATRLTNGDVLLAGGSEDPFDPLASAEVIPASGTAPSVAVGSMSTPRTHHTATLLADGTVLVAGGTDGNSSLATAEIYDPVAQTWSPAVPMNDARSEHAATLLGNGDVLVTGGEDPDDDSSATSELYVPNLPDGSPCASGSQCKSTFCTEGVCCDSACGGAPCEACTKALGATADGTCTPLDGVVCSESPCKVDGQCMAGACTGASPKACAPVDDCHESGVCDPGSGICSLVAKLDGSDCSVGASGGICIAGDCVLDPHLVASGGTASGGTGGATAASGAGSGAGTGGSGGAGDDGDVSAKVSGNGCSSTGTPASNAAPVGLLGALFMAWKKRRRAPRR